MSANNEVVSVVEDELDITILFHDALEKTIYGISVVSFTDSVRAFKHFKKNKKIIGWLLPIGGCQILTV